MGLGSGQETSFIYQAFLDSDESNLMAESGTSLDLRLPEVHPAILQQLLLFLCLKRASGVGKKRPADP